MDLNSITQMYRPTSIDFLPEWREGYAWLAGGTWLFSEPQPSIRALVDLESLSWPALKLQPDGLEIAATCTIAELNAFRAPVEWKASPLFRECSQSLQASFKMRIHPVELRRRNMIRPGDTISSIWSGPSDIVLGSYGLEECLDKTMQALGSGRGKDRNQGEDWLEGKGIAISMLDCGPPTEHRSEACIDLLPDGTYHLAIGSTEFGNGTLTVHRQIAAMILGCAVERISATNADTDKCGYDTGTFASTGIVVAGSAGQK